MTLFGVACLYGGGVFTCHPSIFSQAVVLNLAYCASMRADSSWSRCRLYLYLHSRLNLDLQKALQRCRARGLSWRTVRLQRTFAQQASAGVYTSRR